MCVGDQSLPGGLGAMIKEGWKERKRGRDEVRVFKNKKGGGLHSKKKEERDRSTFVHRS